ncbi:peptidase family S49 protein (macronuclear) [Tetrahymena thermophila SB210]|uniref:Peptidase family S49 protein n=1 Tax=Tetrahymena thermophila (strain SB210) TaxID=312017 RepID=I7M9F9_TETTS|nr:peptidase family S49 protein [Tetrahymena thermophila SB210]EAS01507.2 peptidase family S49 protein [Tetrahymena thermophila SB210]|eukprot:XP_001021754.2 peptidase family S49 protein [Tetrahymena thermophila SB210]
MGFPSISKFLFGPLVPVLRIEGIITPNTTNSIGNKLRKINTSRTEGLAVVLDSRGGSTGQCQTIRNQLLQFSKDNNIPLYCFAENFATHGAYYILSAGNTIYVNPTSIVGNASEPQADIDFSQFLLKNQIESRIIASNPLVNEYRFNWAIKDSEKDKKFIQEITDRISKLILGDIQVSRGKNLKVNEELLTKEYTGKQAINNGLADQFGTYEAILAEKFPLAKLDHTSLTQFSFISSYQWNSRFGKAIPLFLLLSLFSLKVFIKYTLIIQSYLLVSSQEEGQEKEKKVQH